MNFYRPFEYRFNILHLWQNYLIYLIRGAVFFKGGSVKAPDPQKTADAQFGLNKRTSQFEAQQNRYTQNNPLGSIGWRNIGTKDNPNWVQNTKLSPAQQAIFNQQQRTQQFATKGAQDATNRARYFLNGQAYNPMADFAKYKDVIGGDLNTRKHVEDALFGRLNPSLQQDEEALRTRLANQGLQYGTEAYGNAMRDYNQRVNDARLAVIGQGGDEMARSQQLALQGIQAKQGASDQFRNQKLAEMAAMLQGQGNVNIPAYGGATNLSATNPIDYASLVNNKYQGQIANANANTASNNASLAAALQAGGAALGSYLGRK